MYRREDYLIGKEFEKRSGLSMDNSHERIYIHVVNPCEWRGFDVDMT